MDDKAELEAVVVVDVELAGTDKDRLIELRTESDIELESELDIPRNDVVMEESLEVPSKEKLERSLEEALGDVVAEDDDVIGEDNEFAAIELSVVLVDSLMLDEDIALGVDVKEPIADEECAADVDDLGDDEAALHWPKPC